MHQETRETRSATIRLLLSPLKEMFVSSAIAILKSRLDK